MRDAVKERIYKNAKSYGFVVEKLYTLPKGWKIVLTRDEGVSLVRRALNFTSLDELNTILKQLP